MGDEPGMRWTIARPQGRGGGARLKYFDEDPSLVLLAKSDEFEAGLCRRGGVVTRVVRAVQRRKGDLVYRRERQPSVDDLLDVGRVVVADADRRGNSGLPKLDHRPPG